MAKQIIDIGVEGNDGTGDALRESFRKANENFTELYAAFGVEGQLTFENLSDTPESFIDNENKVPVVSPTSDSLVFREFVSNGFLTDDIADDTVRFDFTTDGKIVVTTRNSAVIDDKSPAIGGPLNSSSFAIGNVGTTEEDLQNFLTKHSGTFEVQDLVPDIKYVDENFLTRGSPGEQANVRSEPGNISEYTLTISGFSSNDATVADHGLTTASTGAAYTYSSTGTDATNLTSDTVYYVRRQGANAIGLYPTADDAIADTNQIVVSGGSGTQTLVNSEYDSELFGNWLGNEALPRDSVVRRQGDQMAGDFYLNDHPGSLAGTIGAGGLEDYKAATKFYVDQNSYYSPSSIYVSTIGDDTMAGVPLPDHGRSQQSAYASINKACEKAEEIMLASPAEPGPYMQSIRYNESADASFTTSTGIKTIVPGRLPIKTLIDLNKEFMIEEAIAYTSVTYPDFIYNEATWRDNIDFMIKAIVLDTLSGTNANTLSRTAGLRYYSSPAAQRAISEELTQTIAVINKVKVLANDVIQNNTITSLQTGDALITQTIDLGETVDATGISSVAAKFEIIKDIIADGPLLAPEIVDGSVYEIEFSNGGTGNVDQGKPSNTDLLPGKVVRGKASGALGRIVTYSRDTDVGVADSLELVLLEPVEFEVNEELEFGNLVNNSQVTILIESGIYYEDLPIKVPANVSIKGSEFRRVIIRPADRASQSRWANTYFYRDLEFDGLTGGVDSITGIGDPGLPTAGTAYTNPVTNDVDGYFGRHYLYDPTADVNVSNFGATNVGEYNDAAELINRNRAFIIEEVFQYIEATYPTLTYNFTKCRRDVGLILDAIISDLINGGRKNTLRAQGAYFYQGTDLVRGDQADETEDSINYIKTIAADVLANTAFTALGTVDQVIDTDYTISGNAITTFNSLVSLVTYAFDPAYNPPRHNRDLDVFLMNDATVLRNVTVQGQGGFMMVLDPDGQILTKTPYCQTGSSFSQSLNRQAFRGGMLVDAFASNIPITVDSKADAFTLNVSSPAGTGLFVRRPQTPAPFYIDGIRFQVNSITNYDQQSGTCTLLISDSTNDSNGFTGVTSVSATGVDLDSLPVSITLQTAGNRSALANNFTQINDLGYGLICTNGGTSEIVSQFTYYCWSSSYSKNGSEIRSLNSSSAYGEYGLIAEGADPNEIPDSVTLRNNMLQPFKTFESEVTLTLTGVVSVVAGETLTQAVSGATGDVIFDTDANQVYLTNTSGTFDTSNTITGSTSGALGAASVPTIASATAATNTLNGLTLYVYDLDYKPQNRSEIDMIHDSGTIARYEVSNVQLQTDIIVGGIIDPTYTGGTGTGAEFNVKKTVDNGYIVDVVNGGTSYLVSDTITIDGADLGGITSTNDLVITVTTVDAGAITEYTVAGTVATNTDTPNKDGQVYKLNFTTGSAGFSEGGLVEATASNVPGTLRQNGVFVLNDVFDQNTLISNPGAAIVLDSTPTTTYRSIAFAATESTGEDLATDSVLATFDTNYDYVRLIVDSTEAANADPRGGGGTMGNSVGDTIIAVEPLDETAIARINAGDLVFGWDGKLHRIATYTDRTTYATIEFTDVDGSDIINAASSSSGLITSAVQGIQTITLRAGLVSGAEADITANVSTCRATGHDFLNVGTGGFNTSNYPNVLLGLPRDPAQANEVNERNKGRVFYVSTDQDGFFRVGRFFTVDQGTGTVTFAASIALSNLDGIGFKRGVVVAEFSTDTSMGANATDVVPVQSAVRGYVNRRLGFDHNGVAVNNTIGPGVVAADGGELASDLNAASFKITSLGAPSQGSDAATKNYVDQGFVRISAFGDIRNVFEGTWTGDQLLVASGLKRIFVNEVANGPFVPGDVFTTIGGKQGTVVEVETISNDIIYGDAVTLSYVPDLGVIAEEEEITSGSKTANVLAGPFDEITNATVAGDIEASVTRSTGSTSIDLSLVANTIINNDINASAAIAQSKLDLNAATTRANATGISQNDLGVASFDISTFTATDGWIKITDGAVTLAKLANLANNRMLGNISGVAAAPYGIPTTSGSGASSVLLTQADGSIRVESLRLGGNNTYEVMSLSGTQLNIKTPGQGVVLTANGTSRPIVNIPGNLSMGSASTTESTFQAASTLAGESNISSDWLYTSFIEATGERNATSTGIALGAGTGFTVADEIGLIANGKMPFKITGTGVVPDLTATYNIGTSSATYNNVYTETIANASAVEIAIGAAVPFIANASGFVPDTDAAYNIGSSSFGYNIVYTGTVSDASEVKIAIGAASPFKVSATGIIPDVDSTYNIGSATFKYGTVYADTLVGDGSNITNVPSAGTSEAISTVLTGTNATHYLTFVNSNNGSLTSETLYTDAGITYNPSTNDLTTTGDIVAASFSGDGSALTNVAAASTSNAIATISTATNSAHYLTFVNSNNGSLTSESLYTDAGITYNPSTNALTTTGSIVAASFSGIGSALTNVPAVAIDTIATATNAAHYVTFVNSNNVGAASETLYTDAGITYNPSTNDLTTTGGIVAASFSGDGSGLTNVPGAGSSSTIATIATATNATHYLTFVNSNNVTSAAETLYTDSGITYNPSTNALVVSGNVTPDADNTRFIGSVSRGYNTIYTGTVADSTEVEIAIGAASPLTVTATGIVPDTTATYDIGSASFAYNVIYGTATSARYADLAENYVADAEYEPGTVLVFGGEHEVTIGSTKGDTRVAGVVSTNPAHLMNSAQEGDYVVALALQGRVPTKVLGKVQKGDLLVTSPIPGYACVDNSARSGTVIGKALENKTTDERGVIEAVIGKV